MAVGKLAPKKATIEFVRYLRNMANEIEQGDIEVNNVSISRGLWTIHRLDSDYAEHAYSGRQSIHIETNDPSVKRPEFAVHEEMSGQKITNA